MGQITISGSDYINEPYPFTKNSKLREKTFFSLIYDKNTFLSLFRQNNIPWDLRL